jgi:hypothetical protein
MLAIYTKNDLKIEIHFPFKDDDILKNYHPKKSGNNKSAISQLTIFLKYK